MSYGIFSRGLAVLVMAAVSGVALAGPATHYQIDFPDPATSYTNSQLQVTALDAANAVDTTYTGSITLTTTDPSFIAPALVPFVAGSLNLNGATFKTAGTQTLTATDTLNPALTGSLTVTVLPGPPAQLAVIAGMAATAGVPKPLVVLATDLFGNLTPSVNGTVHVVSSTDPQAVLPADFALVNGMSSAPITFKTAGTQSVTVSVAGVGLPNADGEIQVDAGPTVAFTVTLPGSADPGVEFVFDVASFDAFANATDYAGTIHFSSNDAGATLPPDGVLSFGTGSFLATFAQPNGTPSITATDTQNPLITGSGTATTTPVTLQRFDVE